MSKKVIVSFWSIVLVAFFLSVSFAQGPANKGISVESQLRLVSLMADGGIIQQGMTNKGCFIDQQKLMQLQQEYQSEANSALKAAGFDPADFQLNYNSREKDPLQRFTVTKREKPGPAKK